MCFWVFRQTKRRIGDGRPRKEGGRDDVWLLGNEKEKKQKSKFMNPGLPFQKNKRRLTHSDNAQTEKENDATEITSQAGLVRAVHSNNSGFTFLL